MASSPTLLRIMATVAIFGLMVAPPCAADNALNSPNGLLSGQVLVTGPYSLIMQRDCNLVLYDAGNVVWATNTNRDDESCRLTLHNNGNLAIYDQSNRPIWEVTTNGEIGGYALVLQQDRNLVIYGPGGWDSRTNVTAVGVTAGPHNATASVDAAAEQVIINVAAGAMVK